MKLLLFLPLLTRLFVVLIFCSSSFVLTGQIDNSQRNFSTWQHKWESSKVFIENRGQFSLPEEASQMGEILYAVDNGQVMTYFTKRGVVYHFRKVIRKVKDDEEKEREAKRLSISVEEWKKEEEEEREVTIEEDIVIMRWEFGNSSVQLIAEEKTNDYYNYSYHGEGVEKHISYVSGYKKLVYKNLYDHIDAEYIFHEKDGLEYSFVLKSGANSSRIKMAYESSNKVDLTGKNQVTISTKFGVITDRYPITHYTDNKESKIKSEFIVSQNTVSFLLENHDRTKPITIDPWTVIPTMPTSNKVWEIETDYAGNVYAYGGDSPLVLKKYNSNGVLQWTYTSPWTTTWPGGFVTHPTTGISYINEGSAGGIREVKTDGTVGWTSAPVGGLSNESWTATFNCDFTKLVLGGSRTDFGATGPSITGTVRDVNMTSGTVGASLIVGYGSLGKYQEVSSICASSNGKYYFLTLDTVGSVNQTLTTIGFKVPTLYDLDYYIPGYGLGQKQSISAIKANKTAVYTMNGATLHKRDLKTGAVLATATIPGGISSTTSSGDKTPENGGIDIDSCGNVYVGSSNAVIKFDETLNQLTAMPTTGPVYDLALGKGGEVVVCGYNFVQSLSFTACDRAIPICAICPLIKSVGPFCPTDPAVTLTLDEVGSGGVWSGKGITNASSGTFDPSVAGVGKHTVYYTQSCGKDSSILDVKACAALSVCKESNGTISVSGGTAPYTWEKDTVIKDCSACLIAAFCLPPGCDTLHTWKQFATGKTITVPGVLPLKVSDNSGNFKEINDTVSLSFCSGCPAFAVVLSEQIETGCTSSPTGSFTVSTTGGTGSYDYVLKDVGGTVVTTFNGVFGNQVFSMLKEGTYSLVINDQGGCSETESIAIKKATSPVVALNATQTDCSAADGTATATASGGTPPYTYLWSGGQLSASLTGLSAGTYSLTVTDKNGCTVNSSVSITSIGAPTISTTSTPVACYGDGSGTATATPSGGASPYTYVWSNGQTSNTVTGLNPGNHSVTVTDNTGCLAVALVSVSGPSKIEATPLITNTSCGKFIGEITLNPTGGGSSGYTYLWELNNQTTKTISSLGGGQYVVTITDASACTSVDTIRVGVNGNLGVSIAPKSAHIKQGEVVSLLASGGKTYTWSPKTGLSCITCDNPVASPKATILYYVIGTDESGCVGRDSIVVLVDFICGEVFVPTIFSPNGDRSNDVECVHGNCIKSMIFEIYDRWGEKVFETTNPASCWDGNYKGKPMDSGVFVYKLEAILTNDEVVQKQGNITLTR